MNDRELFANIRLPLTDLLKQFGAPEDLTVERAYNLTQQGRTENKTVYMAKHMNVPRGSPKDYTKWNEQTKQMDYFNEQTIETTVSFQALIPTPCATGLRPDDILALVSRAMQTSVFIHYIAERGLQIMRIIDNQHSYIVNDKDQYEAVPLLQAVFVHTQTLKGTKSRINTRHINITRV